ncbi:DNA mismatch repair protein MutS [Peptostreptococcus sp. MV1]|uniref:DNA mismatch repair protein MutS n=1 Tax=Peptostreptococcus sp. MV1 TaxID=1219626 RepID=UPI00050E1A8C|nr:DNA mismatch repair protein MutS [Peptostreptococcus sp. MV1]KGF15662.1 DNA mismatch repair protein MutS [Peptostreptococcus sp. MV1]
MNIDREKLSPMMKKYLETKDEYPDCILFYRLGDFYEMFFDDALLASKILDIALTGKACGLEERAPMCGVPYHSASSYLSKLVEAGYKVAIGEQVEDPATAKGLVKRAVVKIVTPGTLLEDDSLERTSNKYLMAIYCHGQDASIAYVDISTGELNASLMPIDKVKNEVAKILPSEIISNSHDILSSLTPISDMANIYLNQDFDSVLLDDKIVGDTFDQAYLDKLGLGKDNLIIYSLAIVLNYITRTQMMKDSNINTINIYQSGDYMVLDLFTRINLELTKTIRSNKKKGSLLQVLDATSTPMGSRMLKKQIEQPLINKDMIDHRLDVTQEIKDDYILTDELKTSVSSIFDLERICAKIAYDRVSPKDLVNLKNSIGVLPSIIETISNSSASGLKSFISGLDCLDDIYELVNKSIMDAPSQGIKDGNVIKAGYSEELDQLRDISQNGAFMIKDIEQREREKTGTKSLKIGYNKVFGYYIEITKAALVQMDIDESYIRKQTLVNAERFITPELKEIEDKILNAEDKIKTMEYEFFKEIRNEIYKNIERIQIVASKIAQLDLYLSNAIIANRYKYTRPSINQEGILYIDGGRHPVIEQIIGEENFIDNDTSIGYDNMINIITGPNMSGKSTYMRQVALITLMAHIGSFVPARSANIPIVDRIFTRVGASDDLAQGQSTFMVEMDEVSQILSNATKDSLIILDEIGRGTSTYDGISLAWSIVEYIHKNIGAKTLFATHYHELTDLEGKYPRIQNHSVSVQEDGEDVVFLRKIVQGAADKSYGIYVAKLAKLPDQVIERADQILAELEKKHIENSASIDQSNKDDIQLSFDTLLNPAQKSPSKIKDTNLLKETDERAEFHISTIKSESFDNLKIINDSYKVFIEEILDIDIMNSTPMDIMNTMYELQKKAKKISKN